MPVILTYDVKKTSDTIHTELKDRLKTFYGYSDRITGGDGKWYSLPNTTLIKNSSNNEAAVEFQKACMDVGATWEKFIAADRGMSTVGNK